MNFTEDEIGRRYAQLMDEVAFRLEYLHDTVQKLKAGSISGPRFLNAEFGFFQVRLVCELVALAVVIAHDELPEGISPFLKEYRADAIFHRLAAINEDSFPAPVEVETDNAANAAKVFFTGNTAVDRVELRKIYTDCDNYLHRGRLKNVLASPSKVYPIAKLERWTERLVNLLKWHVIVLPHANRSLLVQLKSSETGLAVVYNIKAAP